MSLCTVITFAMWSGGIATPNILIFSLPIHHPLTLWCPIPPGISKMSHKMFDESQKSSGYTKEVCKSQYVDHICTIWFIKKNINILKLIMQGFLWKFDFKSHINTFLLNFRETNSEWDALRDGVISIIWFLLFLKNHIYEPRKNLDGWKLSIAT